MLKCFQVIVVQFGLFLFFGLLNEDKMSDITKKKIYAITDKLLRN